jgi:hypothetical protein
MTVEMNSKTLAFKYNVQKRYFIESLIVFVP